MELIKARIKNYKSIVDSGDIYFSSTLTILAGKNESGKTSILEALEDFHENSKIRETARRFKGEGVPEVAVTFKLDKSEVDQTYKEAGLDQSVKGGMSLTLIKRQGIDGYVLDGDSRAGLGFPSIYSLSRKTILDAQKEMQSIIKRTVVNLPVPELTAANRLEQYKLNVNTFRDQVLATVEISEDDKSSIALQADTVESASDKHYERERECSAFIKAFVDKKLPYFILFSSFEDNFPESVELSKLAESEWAKDLEAVTDFRIEKISSVNKQEQINHQEQVNAEFTDKFEKFWSQDSISLQISKDGDNVNFWIVEGGDRYLPSQRSKGQQWYLSFYIKIVARLREGVPNVILVDEPGLYLHAKAQKDLLKILTAHSSTYPVIFSTHSPYLIREDLLENVRLIEKRDGCTNVLGKVHAHPTADKETLTPILTAIGLGINDSITNLDQKNNVVVEGIEDVFYLQAFKYLLGTTTLNFINGGGASNMGIVGAVLEGWGANVFYLFDNDQGKKDGTKRLKEWRVLPDLIKVVLEDENTTIADVLSQSDFKKFVLEDSFLKYASLNSAYIKGKSPKPDKVLLARQFLQKAKRGEVELDAKSAANINSLFRKIDFK